MNLTIATVLTSITIFAIAFLILFFARKKTGDIEIEDILLGSEELEKHAAETARRDIPGTKKGSVRVLMPRVNQNFRFITQTFEALNSDLRQMLPTVPSAEWLLDNYYIIEEQVKDIRHCITKGYYTGLPVLKSGYLKGYPRAYAIALEIVSHTDGVVDEKILISYIRAYQSQSLLTMGELWALAAMIRIALVEKIQQICVKIMESRNDWSRAVQIADMLTGDSAEEGDVLPQFIKDKLGNTLSTSLIQHLLQILRKRGVRDANLLKYIDEKLEERNMSTAAAAESEHQLQASMQVSVGNSITSLRSLSAFDWNDVFESLSQVEQILKEDSSGVYSCMDFESRNYYRNTVEKLAGACGVSEAAVALSAVECAAKADAHGVEEAALKHVGYYLVGNNGRRKLISRIKGKTEEEIRPLCKGRKCRVLVYIGGIALITAVITAIFAYYAVDRAASMEYFFGILAAVVVLIPVSDVVITLVNIIIGWLHRPVLLPKLDFSGGIPEESAVMVIVPTLLPNEKRAKDLIDQLEVIYLGNRDENTYFALVGDFKDAHQKEMSDDKKITGIALDGIKKLNKRYGEADRDRFFYFHRSRKFNDHQQKWMGWERKRGAIIEFNELMSGSSETGFDIVSRDLGGLPHIKYIITLDADTVLPMGAARRLAGTISHPLNRAMIDSDRCTVTEGYGLLQPRVSVSITSANSTLFSKIFAGQGGIDPYTTAVSDVYQDLFGEGIFTGKGIYELDTFQKVLKYAVPDNTILSHDLLEGSYIRTGLVTDIELTDGYPVKYNSSSMRLHRWVRGDWQLLPWLLPSVRDRHGRLIKNPLSVLSRWKILDNLRRSLINPALLMLILWGISVLPGSSLVWVGLAVFTVFTPVWSYIISGILTANLKLERHKQHSTVISGFKAAIYQALLMLVFIPYQAYLMSDAVIRTLGRVVFTHKNMLEWVTAADMEANLKNDRKSFWKRMWIGVLFGAAAAALSVVFKAAALPAALVLLVLWTAAPDIAYIISKPCVRKKENPSNEDILMLRSLARKTWAYYEDLADSEDNYLPPDNCQEEPTRVIAHRTSPTNIGFLLMAIVSARDLGFIGSYEMLKRIDNTISTVEKLDKWKGHLYNWYDTITLNVLRPYYVSTVDSGNLVGYLMVLEQALKEYIEKLPIDAYHVHGLISLLHLLTQEIEDTGVPFDNSRLERLLSVYDVEYEQFYSLLENMKVQVNGQGIRKELEKLYWGKKLVETIDAFEFEIKHSQSTADSFRSECESLIGRINSLIRPMEFKALFDSKRQLFSIGYNVEEGRLTKSYYDLLASESRQASYIAVARGEVGQKHWFRLGRKLASVQGYKGLVSWTGTMFEYLMPMLLMKTYENTLMDETYSFILRNQIRYGEQHDIAWGVSESGYYAFDIALNYQYKAFGIPELGLKRGLENDIVIAPYASILAIGINPRAVIENIKRLESEGVGGLYGLYEAIDYTPSRLVKNERCNIVKSFMAHHQGMSLVALNNFLNNNIIQNRFHADPIIRSAELLLQERVPGRVTFTKEQHKTYVPSRKTNEVGGEVIRSFGVPDTYLPHVHILSNGAYSVVVTNGGSGCSKIHDIAVSRWNKDFRGGSKGIFIFVQNLNSNDMWSAAYEPVKAIPDEYRVVFSPDKAEFIRKDGNIETHTEITVSPEDNAEIRRVTLTNYSEYTREFELTSYFEAVLAHPDADMAHPAFSNLFIRTEYINEHDSLIASRRPRTEKQKPVWAVHTIAIEGEASSDVYYETDRLKFIGRNRDISDPLALDVSQPLSNTAGAVLDPIMSLRRRVRVEPGKSARVIFVIAAAETYKRAVELADKYHDPKNSTRAFELAWTRSQIEAEYLGMKSDDVKTYLDMIPSIIYSSQQRRAWEEVILRNKKGQRDLWQYGISGDVPVVLVSISSRDHIDMVHWLLRAHEFWRIKGLLVDLLIMLEDESSYTQPLYDACRDAAASSHARDLIDKRGGVFIRNAKQMPHEDIVLMYTVAKIALRGNEGTVKEQLEMQEDEIYSVKTIDPDAGGGFAGKAAQGSKTSKQEKISGFEFFNGLGGFSPDAREYVICICEKQYTPAPWINVISNKRFGFNISESGSGFTWSENSRENKLTPWSNDPVTDPPGEVFYVKDEKSGEAWSITPQPIREESPYVVRHGLGYTGFEHTSHDIEQRLTLFTAVEEPVKISIIKLKNLSRKKRQLSLTYYIRPVLGVSDQVTAQYITTRLDENTGALMIENTYNTEFQGRIAFVGVSEAQCSYTGDRVEFLGINGSMDNPEALKRERLCGRLGAGYDPCAAIQVKVELDKDAEKELVFLLGQGKDIKEAADVVLRFKNVGEAKAELDKAKQFWADKLEAIKVSTPDASMNILLNGWLLYQVISCRLWSRSAFYQSGGAYGFRDQLQDVMAAVYAWPDIMREQILLHAAHQYIEGDVQHWWHEEAGKGIRTKYSDDLVWLAYVTADYIENTGDFGILEEEAGYLESEMLGEHEDERYEMPALSKEKSSLYEHCLRVIDRSLRYGEHGIPLMGCGDWNDGMNNVGSKGRGESVWLGWFIYTTIKKFIPLCEYKGDKQSVEKYEDAAKKIADAIENNAWDGNWYRRAYFDDGKPLGSSENYECRIDSISQSWAVISDAGKPARIKEAMNAVDKYLIDSEHGLIKLLTPPFDKGELEPGYIKGYVPGVRENGGQYTHAAVWVVLAYAKMGLGDKACQLFNLINPINHTRTPIEYNKYKLEPYVMAADVYAAEPHTGRGGWSWYTGAAGWMYRVGIEHILGMKKINGRLLVEPCIPREWKQYKVSYRHGKTNYEIKVENPQGVSSGVKNILIDGEKNEGNTFLLQDDGKQHTVKVIMG